jgi:hypothetical protein
MGPILTQVYHHTTSLAHSRKPHKSRSGGGRKKKIQHLIETDGISFLTNIFYWNLKFALRKYLVAES